MTEQIDVKFEFLSIKSDLLQIRMERIEAFSECLGIAFEPAKKKLAHFVALLKKARDGQEKLSAQEALAEIAALLSLANEAEYDAYLLLSQIHKERMRVTRDEFVVSRGELAEEKSFRRMDRLELRIFNRTRWKEVDHADTPK